MKFLHFRNITKQLAQGVLPHPVGTLEEKPLPCWWRETCPRSGDLFPVHFSCCDNIANNKQFGGRKGLFGLQVQDMVRHSGEVKAGTQAAILTSSSRETNASISICSVSFTFTLVRAQVRDGNSQSHSPTDVLWLFK